MLMENRIEILSCEYAGDVTDSVETDNEDQLSVDVLMDLYTEYPVVSN